MSVGRVMAWLFGGKPTSDAFRRVDAAAAATILAQERAAKAALAVERAAQAQARMLQAESGRIQARTRAQEDKSRIPSTGYVRSLAEDALRRTDEHAARRAQSEH